MWKIKLSTKQTLASILLIATGFVCDPIFAETPEIKSNAPHHEHDKLDWPGIYNGFLPCADCIGLKTSLALNKNNSYILITQYTGKSPRDFVEKGKFTWSDKKDKIVLTSRDGSTTHHFLVGENTLTQLDNNGNRISGKEADRYVLRRTDVTSEPSSSAHPGH